VRAGSVSRYWSISAALAAAILFGAATPFAKQLVGEIPSTLLAGLLYLGSGVGLLIVRLIRDGGWRSVNLAPGEYRWLGGAILFGGVIAPVLLMIGLSRTAANTSSLLLNLEAVFTATFAWWVFKENAGSRIVWGMAAIVAGGIVLAWPSSTGERTTGTLWIAVACVCWAIDNNLTRKISANDALLLAGSKGFIAGLANTLLAMGMGAALPRIQTTSAAMAIGQRPNAHVMSISTSLFVLLCLGAMSSPVRAQANLPVQSGRASELESVIVTGEQPGPGMWKIKKDGNVLWILGTYGPLPKNVVWRSREVENVVAASRELYVGGGFETYASNSRSEVRRLMKALQIGDAKTLKDVVPIDLYMQFSALNQKYAHSDKSLEGFRPFFAGQELTRRALNNRNLSSDGGVDKTVRRLAKQYRVEIHSLTVRDDAAAPQLISALEAQSLEMDIPCFRSHVLKLETTIGEAVARANAWSVGDIAKLRESFMFKTENSTDPCLDFLRHGNRFNMEGIEAENFEDNALRVALDKNQSTLAVLRIERLLRPRGVLERFRADGYEIEEPF